MKENPVEKPKSRQPYYNQKKIRTLLLRDIIIANNLSSGDRLPSLRILSEKFNANPATVSKVIQDLVSEEALTTKDRSGVYIKDISMCYRLSARNCLIAFIGSNYPQKTEYLLGQTLKHHLRRHDYTLISNHGSWKYEDIDDFLGHCLMNFTVSGIIFNQLNEAFFEKKWFLKAKERNVPMSMIDCEYKGEDPFVSNLPKYTSFHDQSFQALAELLKKRKHKKNLFIGNNTLPTASFLNTWKKTCQKNDLRLLRRLTAEIFDINEEQGIQIRAAIDINGVNSIFCQNSFLARSVYKYLKMCHYPIKSSISIIGTNKIDTDLDAFDLTYLDLNTKDLSSEIVNNMLGTIENPEKTSQITDATILESKIIEGDT